ncbi:hypothetical protein F0562_021697 [Nyssa sinensis]|uniref:HIT domain-containing protein n=1 Tax=Nyssa sinensis TaxID=561372 RepID=A0A5J5BP36_9ASTE|nr:hypothetical protein F0562_021697 [Nyssa sinensis]
MGETENPVSSVPRFGTVCCDPDTEKIPFLRRKIATSSTRSLRTYLIVFKTVYTTSALLEDGGTTSSRPSLFPSQPNSYFVHFKISRNSETNKLFSCVSPLYCASASDGEKGSQGNDCVFCKIIRGETPAVKLYEDDICLCILDINPVSHGHSLIIPKSHYSSLQATPPPVLGAMCSKVPFISNAVMKATSCDSFNLLVNNGAAAGQVIFHTHIHVIPRKAHDCLWASESLRRHPLKLDQETSQLADHIREQLLFSERSEDGKSHGSTVLAN